MARTASREFAVGDKIEFDSRRNLQVIRGTIINKGPKNATVKVDEFNTFRVPYSMLRTQWNG
jgi:hypothetical protein